MSNHTVSSKGGAMAAEGHKTRRAALRARAGAGALSIPTISAIADPLSDPIFVAIEHHQAAFHAMRAAIPGMKARKWGRIISTASAHSLIASPFKSAYVTAKHGLAGLTKTAALETATFGITVNAISPGYVCTPWWSARFRRPWPPAARPANR